MCFAWLIFGFEMQYADDFSGLLSAYLLMGVGGVAQARQRGTLVAQNLGRCGVQIETVAPGSDEVAEPLNAAAGQELTETKRDGLMKLWMVVLMMTAAGLSIHPVMGDFEPVLLENLIAGFTAMASWFMAGFAAQKTDMALRTKARA